MTLIDWLSSVVGTTNFDNPISYIAVIVSCFVVVYILDAFHDVLDFVLDLIKRK